MPNGSYSISDIQVYFVYIFKNMEKRLIILQSESWKKIKNENWKKNWKQNSNNQIWKKKQHLKLKEDIILSF